MVDDPGNLFLLVPGHHLGPPLWAAGRDLNAPRVLLHGDALEVRHVHCAVLDRLLDAHVLSRNMDVGLDILVILVCVDARDEKTEGYKYKWIVPRRLHLDGFFYTSHLEGFFH